MGLASKIAAANAAPGGAPAAASAYPAAPGGGGYAAPPKPAYPQAGAAPGGYPPAGQPGAFGAPQPGQQPGGYGAPQQGQQPGGYGAPQQGQQPGGYSAPQQGQQPGAYPPPAAGQQAYGQQPGAFGAKPAGQAAYPPQQGAPAGSNIEQGLRTKLEQIINANRLQAFYPPQALQAVLNRLNTVNFRQVAARWNMPMELATDLASLALYDIVIYADDSGSMIFEEGGDRVNDLKLIVGRVAEVATLFDEDGIMVRFMNSPMEGNGIRDAASANNLLGQVQYSGLTPLGTNLNKKVIQPFLAAGVNGRNLAKPILVIAITDGEPAGEPHNTIQNVIKSAKDLCANSAYGPGAIAFQFAQVGKDQSAQAFLATLDNDPVVGKMVDATSYYELEAEEYAKKGVNLTPDVWLVKLMVGAIDPTFDEQD